MEAGQAPLNPDGATLGYGLGVSVNGKKALGDCGFVGLFGTGNGIDCASGESVREMDFVEANVGVLGDFDPAGVVESKELSITEMEDDVNGVLIPDKRSNRSITEFNPVEFVADLKNVAQGDPMVSMVDVLMLKSRLCAFYEAKGGYLLPEYYEPQQIPGLEDTATHDGDEDVPAQGVLEETVHPRGVRFKANAGLRSGRKRRKAAGEADDERDVVESKENNGKGYAPRVRKKSKYLSPPYTDMFHGPQREDSETESDEVVSASVDHGSLNSSRANPMIIELPVKVVLSEIRSAALFALHPDEKADDNVIEFLHIYRSSTYVGGSDCHMYESSPKGRGRKRKSMISEAGLSGSLFVTFGPGSFLPTKGELIELYKSFGDLVENETDVFHNSFCACVVFVRNSDAEKAFKSSQESSPFGTANVTFRLRNTLPPPNRRIKTATMKSSASEEANGETSQQDCDEEELETMTGNGVRGLLEEMNTVG